MDFHKKLDIMLSKKHTVKCRHCVFIECLAYFDLELTKNLDDA